MIELIVLLLFIIFSMTLLITKKKIILKDFYLIILYFIICCLISVYNGNIKKIFIYTLVLCSVLPFFKDRYSIFMINMSEMLRATENYFIENNINYKLIKVNKFHSVLKLNNYKQEIILKSLCFWGNIKFKNYNVVEISKILDNFHED
ncbi:hypothetical protein [Crassaminicella indica]|uniref:Uncharacterized protein n=1 Tax=Crassaminicella indica TaxID=2855394 RepID=A0ABX8RDP2_9CLOT|nr:hypothetical protein [Crassaminicella indica]QXM07158.1 hypothetical protein KVH43_05515 [Crassaminicella indica]